EILRLLSSAERPLGLSAGPAVGTGAPGRQTMGGGAADGGRLFLLAGGGVLRPVPAGVPPAAASRGGSAEAVDERRRGRGRGGAGGRRLGPRPLPGVRPGRGLVPDQLLLAVGAAPWLAVRGAPDILRAGSTAGGVALAGGGGGRLRPGAGVGPGLDVRPGL